MKHVHHDSDEYGEHEHHDLDPIPAVVLRADEPVPAEIVKNRFETKLGRLAIITLILVMIGFLVYLTKSLVSYEHRIRKPIIIPSPVVVTPAPTGVSPKATPTVLIPPPQGRTVVVPKPGPTTTVTHTATPKPKPRRTPKPSPSPTPTKTCIVMICPPALPKEGLWSSGVQVRKGCIPVLVILGDCLCCTTSTGER